MLGERNFDAKTLIVSNDVAPVNRRLCHGKTKLTFTLKSGLPCPEREGRKVSGLQNEAFGLVLMSGRLVPQRWKSPHFKEGKALRFASE